MGSWGIKDFNLCDKNGYYTIAGGKSSGVLNSPGIDYGIMFYAKGNDDKSYSIQYAFDMFEAKIAFRMTESSAQWGEWKLIT